MPDICRSLDRIAKTGIAMELNTSGVNKTTMNPCHRAAGDRKRKSCYAEVSAYSDRVQTGIRSTHLVADAVRAGQLLLNRKRYEIPIVDVGVFKTERASVVIGHRS